MTALSLHGLKFSRYKQWPQFFYSFNFLFFSIFICFKGILKHIMDVFITQKHLGILRLPRPWSHPITSLWSSFPLVITNRNSCGYCLLKESKSHVIPFCSSYHHRRSHSVKFYHCDHALNAKSFQSQIFQIHQLNVPNQHLEPRSTHLYWSKLKIIPYW